MPTEQQALLAVISLAKHLGLEIFGASDDEVVTISLNEQSFNFRLDEIDSDDEFADTWHVIILSAPLRLCANSSEHQADLEEEIQSMLDCLAGLVKRPAKNLSSRQRVPTEQQSLLAMRYLATRLDWIIPSSNDDEVEMVLVSNHTLSYSLTNLDSNGATMGVVEITLYNLPLRATWVEIQADLEKELRSILDCLPGPGEGSDTN